MTGAGIIVEHQDDNDDRGICELIGADAVAKANAVFDEIRTGNSGYGTALDLALWLKDSCIMDVTTDQILEAAKAEFMERGGVEFERTDSGMFRRKQTIDIAA